MKANKKLLSLLLAVILMFAVIAQPILSARAASVSSESSASEAETSESNSTEEQDEALSPADISNKEEIIYANLDASGLVDSIYAVNQFDVVSDGQLTDYGEYSSVTNLTSTKYIELEDGVVTAAADKGQYYYQGSMNTTDLPWSFDIGYFLDGTETTAEEIAGQSGALEIKISVKQNLAVNDTFFKNYMLQISTTLDSEICSGIKSDRATIANAGKNKVIVHTVLPGKAAELSITSQVENFSMLSIEIAAMPYSSPIDMPDTDDMLGEMTSLTDAISALNIGIAGLDEGVGDLNNGAWNLVNGSKDFASGLSSLSKNSSQLTSGSSQIKTALATIASSLSSSGGTGGLGDLAELPAGLRQLSGGLSQVSAGLRSLKEGYAAMYSALDYSIMSIPPGSLSEYDIQGLYAVVTDPAQQELLNQLAANYSAAQTVRATYSYGDPSIKTGMEQVSGSLETMAANLDSIVSGLNTMADSVENAMNSSDLTSQLLQLSKGLSSLSSQYSSFHSGLVEYSSGVSRISSGYSALHGGLVELGNGTDQLADGAATLYRGSSQLETATLALPDNIQVEIDALMEEYAPSEFEPVSFTSDKNDQTSKVQFIIMTAAIKLPEQPDAQEEEQPAQNIWDRFLDLFR